MGLIQKNTQLNGFVFNSLQGASMDKSQEELGYIAKPRTAKRVSISDYGKKLSTDKARQKYLKQAMKALKADIKS